MRGTQKSPTVRPVLSTLATTLLLAASFVTAASSATAAGGPLVGPPNNILVGSASSSSPSDIRMVSCFAATPTTKGGCSGELQGESPFADVALVSPTWTTSTSQWASSWTYGALPTKVAYVELDYCLAPTSCVQLGRPAVNTNVVSLEADIVDNGVEKDSTPHLVPTYDGSAISADNILLASMTCTDLLDCVATGMAQFVTGPQLGFRAIEVAENAGVWSIGLLAPNSPVVASPSPVLTPPFLSQVEGDFVTPVCVTSKFCLAVGQPFVTATGQTQTYLATELNGKWTRTFVAPSDFLNEAFFQDVSCWGVNDCVAAGSYQATDNLYHAMYATDINGTWTAYRLGTLDPLGATSSELGSVSCTSNGSCWAAGDYEVAGAATPFVVQRNAAGVWGTPTSLPIPTGTTAVMLDNISCPTVTACVAVGGYSESTASPGTYNSVASDGLIAILHDGHWTATASTHQPQSFQPLFGLSCSSAGYCAATSEFTQVTTFNLESSVLPGAPSGLKVSAGTTAAVLTWKAPPSSGSPIETYEYSTNNGRSWRLTNATTTRQKITGLSKNLIYRVRVRAFNGLGVGASSKFINVKLKVSSGSS